MILMRKSITIKAKKITAILSYSFNKKTPIIQVNKIIYIIGIYDKYFKICYRAKYAKKFRCNAAEFLLPLSKII